MVTGYVIQVKYFTCIPSIIGLGLWLGLGLISLTLIGFLITTCVLWLYFLKKKIFEEIWGINRRDLIPHIFLRNFFSLQNIVSCLPIVTWQDWRLQIVILIRIPIL